MNKNLRNKDIRYLLKQLKEHDRLTYEQAIDGAYILAQMVYSLMGDRKEASLYAKAFLLHDIGKLFVPKEILQKDSYLDANEYKIIKKHCQEGQLYLHGYFVDTKIENDVMQACLYHHERMNGEGYFKEIKYDEIPLVAHVVGFVDIYVALLKEKPYRKAYNKEEALEIIMRHTEENNHYVSIAYYYILKNFDLKVSGAKYYDYI